ncbi:saccharopine dehydrogenase [Nocardia suismassiliense]|uniref:Saccharopine dehydrogenase n=1 Tax=Nocardia suismassiliense TaxID=2077092 RepID=A0ABW6QRL7_9NOCA
MEQPKSVLMLGGSGVAGAGAARFLRQWHPSLPLTIAGRDLGRAQRLADELGGARAVTVDLARDDLGSAEGAEYSAVVATVWDNRLNGLAYAQRHGLPYLSISSGLVDIGPEIVASAQRSNAVPILVGSHWFAGLLVLATLELAREFEQVDGIRIGALIDDQDLGGPAGLAELARWSALPAAGFVRRDGVFSWIGGADAQASVAGVDGTIMPGFAMAYPDVPSLGLATGAENVRFDLAFGATASRRHGAAPSMEIRIDLDGIGDEGEPHHRGYYVVHPKGQGPLTSLGVALGVERLLGLRDEAPVGPGIHTPEALLAPAYAVGRMLEMGTIFLDAATGDPVGGLLAANAGK